MHSHHSHSGQFCKHATGTLHDVVQAAIERGFRVYGMTEHVPRYKAEHLYPEEQGMTSDELVKQFEAFVEEACRLRDVYEMAGLSLLVGCETEVIDDASLDQLSTLLDSHKAHIDYVVGSVHHVHGIPLDFDRATYARCLASCQSSRSTYFFAYFDAQYEMLVRVRPEVVGHMDLCRLFEPEMKLEGEVWETVTRNVKFAVEYGALFEVNAAAFKKGWASAYPGEDVLKLILSHGGRLCLSDDAHGPHQVGLYYGSARDYLRRMGVGDLWYLARTYMANAAGRRVVARKVEGAWWDDDFWKREVNT